jgi:hypothetical protein
LGTNRKEDLEPYWQDEKDRLCTVEFLPTDDPEARLFAADIIGYLCGYAHLTNTRSLALIGDPDASAYELSLIKTSHTRGMSHLRSGRREVPSIESGHDLAPSAFSRLDCQCFRSPSGSHPGKPRSPPTAASAARQETSPTTECWAKAVLGHVAKPLVRVGEASRLGHTPNGCRLASSRLPTVLEVAFTKGKVGRTEAGEPRDSSLDSPDVC